MHVFSLFIYLTLTKSLQKQKQKSVIFNFECSCKSSFKNAFRRLHIIYNYEEAWNELPET